MPQNGKNFFLKYDTFSKIIFIGYFRQRLKLFRHNTKLFQEALSKFITSNVLFGKGVCFGKMWYKNILQLRYCRKFQKTHKV